MPGFNTLPAVGGGGGQANMTFVASIHMQTYNRSWAQGGTSGYYALYSTNQESGYAYFVGSGTSTGAPLNRLVNVSHAFTRIDVIAPTNDMVSLYKAKVKSTTVFNNPFAADPSIGKLATPSFPSIIRGSGNFVLPNNALPLVNVVVVGGGGGGGRNHSGHGGGGGGGGGNVVKLTAYQAVGTTSVTIGGAGSGGSTGGNGGTSFFGNVYALGGGGGGDHGSEGNGGSNVGNAGGNGGAYSYKAPVSGTTQSAGTGLGTAGSPAFHGGHAGGASASHGGHGNNRASGGGGGAMGAGQEGTTGNYPSGGAGHVSDIVGSNHSFGGGAYGQSPDGRHGSQGWDGYSAYGHGGHGNATVNSQPNGNGGDSGAVIVRYYIP